MLRIRYARTELSEGIVEDLDADKFVVHEDNTLELRRINPKTGRYRVVGMVHPDRWESIMLVEESV